MAFNLKTNIKGERIYLFSYFHPGLFFRHYQKWMFFLCFVFASERGRRRSVSCCREVQALTTDCYCSATMSEIAHRADSFINRYFVLDNTSLQLNGTCCFSHVLSLHTEFPKSYMFKFMALKILEFFELCCESLAPSQLKLTVYVTSTEVVVMACLQQSYLNQNNCQVLETDAS